MNLTNKVPMFKILTPEPLSEEDALAMEKFHIDEYKNNGWILLNKIRGGSLGGRTQKWSKNLARIEASKYPTRKQFQRNCRGGYKFSWKNGFLDEFFPNSQIQKPTNYWNYEKCKEASLIHVRRMDLMRNLPSAYNSSARNGWLDEFFPIKSKYWVNRKPKEKLIP